VKNSPTVNQAPEPMSVKPSGAARPLDRAVEVGQRLFDGLFIYGALALATALYPLHWETRHTFAVAAAILTFYMLAELHGLYRSWRGSPLRRELIGALSTWATALPILLFIAFITKTSADYSRTTVLIWFALTPTCMLAGRAAVRFALRSFRASGRNSRTAAILGSTQIGVQLAQRLSDPAFGIRVEGFYDDRLADSSPGNARVAVADHAGPFQKLLEKAKSGEIDTIYIALPLRAEERIADYVRQLANTTATVYMASVVFCSELMQGQWSAVADIPVVSIFNTPFHGLGGWVKRAEDIAVSSVLLVLLFFPMLAIGIAVKLTSPGPAFFVQRRYGLNGENIPVYKFRTMSVTEDGPVVRQAQRNDPRVTPLGAFLRANSLDELPQFLNVFLGHMSIVGPRPHAVAHNEEYRKSIYGYMLRHKVKPGITGWAQVNGWRGETDTLEKMQRRVDHDLHYIDNWSLLWDLRIIFLTVAGSRAKENAF